MSKISIDSVVFVGAIYPRDKPITSVIEEYADAKASGAKFPPIILEEGTNRLLDGYHRWKAHKKIIEEPTLFADNLDVSQYEFIEVEYHTIPDGVTPLMYCYSLSGKHGVRPKRADAEKVAQGQYKEMPGTPISTMAKYLGVSDKTVKKYIKPLIAQFEETRRTIIMRLEIMGWTQQEIAHKLVELFPSADGTSQQSVANFLPEIGSFRNLVRNENEKGLASDAIAKRYELPEALALAVVLDESTDSERLDRLNIKLQPYDVWQFPACHDLMGDQHPGRIPGQLIAHVLYFFTEPGAQVIDPMVGSGTTLDACLLMGRKCYGFDIDERHERPDIIKHDIVKDGWHERVKKADLIFWDPPYYSKMDSSKIGSNGYIEGSISKLSRDEYLDFFAKRLTEAKKLVKKGTKLAFLMSDWDDDTGKQEGIFIWDYANTITNAGWKLVRHIQAPLSTQQVHPDIVNKFRESRRLARLERYLFIAEA